MASTYEQLLADTDLRLRLDLQDDAANTTLVAQVGSNGALAGTATTTSERSNVGPTSWLPKSIQSKYSPNHYLNLGAPTWLNSRADFSMCLWIKFTDLANDGYLAAKDSLSTSLYPFSLWRDDAASVSGRTNTFSAIIVESNLGQSVRLEGASGIANDTSVFKHVAMSFDGSSGTLRLIIDGVEDANSPSINALCNSLMTVADDIFLGRNDAAGVTKTISFAQALFFGRVVTPAEFATIHAGPTGESLSGNALFDLPTFDLPVSGLQTLITP